MRIEPLQLSGTYLITFAPRRDERGYFLRVFDASIFAEHGLTTTWVQENQSLSNRKGLIRGLHFQRPPHAETKLVRVVVGDVFDVFVDLRRDSETFGKWAAVELSADAHNAVYIPKGFAHGFCTLSENTIVQYKMDAYHAPQSADGIRWNDETLEIAWPTCTPQVSERDSVLPRFRDLVLPLFGE
jgi:dTDP-4-dehydrorhamnose 3,5-epimerase